MVYGGEVADPDRFLLSWFTRSSLSTAPIASSTQESSGRSIPTGTSTIFSTIEARIGAQMIPDAPSFSARAAATMHSSRECAEYPRMANFCPA